MKLALKEVREEKQKYARENSRKTHKEIMHVHQKNTPITIHILQTGSSDL